MAQSSSDEGGDLSIMCWGDTCTRWDLITRLFTLCDHFSTSAYKGIPGMQEIWSTGAVFISQSLDIARPEILSGTRALQFQPAITKVGKSSWAFKTDILDVDAGLIVARQGAVMCHVDGSSSKSKQLPQGVKLDLQAKIVPDSAPLCTLSVIEPEDSSEVILGRSEVRISDCDKLGHVNNAKWVHLIFEALFRGGYRASTLEHINIIQIQYLGQARPGDSLVSRIWRNKNNGYIHLEFTKASTVSEIICRASVFSPSRATL